MGVVYGGAHRRPWRGIPIVNLVKSLDTGTPMVFNSHMTTTRNTDDAPSFDLAAAIADNTAAQTVHAWERETGR